MLREWPAAWESRKACYADQNYNHVVNAVYQLNCSLLLLIGPL